MIIVNEEGKYYFPIDMNGDLNYKLAIQSDLTKKEFIYSGVTSVNGDYYEVEFTDEMLNDLINGEYNYSMTDKFDTPLSKGMLTIFTDIEHQQEADEDGYVVYEDDMTGYLTTQTGATGGINDVLDEGLYGRRTGEWEQIYSNEEIDALIASNSGLLLEDGKVITPEQYDALYNYKVIPFIKHPSDAPASRVTANLILPSARGFVVFCGDYVYESEDGWVTYTYRANVDKSTLTCKVTYTTRSYPKVYQAGEPTDSSVDIRPFSALAAINSMDNRMINKPDIIYINDGKVINESELPNILDRKVIYFAKLQNGTYAPAPTIIYDEEGNISKLCGYTYLNDEDVFKSVTITFVKNKEYPTYELRISEEVISKGGGLLLEDGKVITQEQYNDIASYKIVPYIKNNEGLSSIVPVNRVSTVRGNLKLTTQYFNYVSDGWYDLYENTCTINNITLTCSVQTSYKTIPLPITDSSEVGADFRPLTAKLTSEWFNEKYIDIVLLKNGQTISADEWERIKTHKTLCLAKSTKSVYYIPVLATYEIVVTRKLYGYMYLPSDLALSNGDCRFITVTFDKTENETYTVNITEEKIDTPFTYTLSLGDRTISDVNLEQLKKADFVILTNGYTRLVCGYKLENGDGYGISPHPTGKFVIGKYTISGNNVTSSVEVVDLFDNYYNKTEVDNLISGQKFKTINNQSILGEGNIEVGGEGGGVTIEEVDNEIYTKLVGYATEQWVVGTLTPYATKEEIPSLTGYATETWVEGKGYITEIPSDYVTEAELDSKGYLTEIPSEYITETELEAKGYLTEIPDNYAKKSDIPDISNLATKDELPVVPTNVSAFNNDAGYLTEHQKLKTINNQSIIGEGNITVGGEAQGITEEEARAIITSYNYTTMQSVEAKGYLTGVPSEYVTETELDAKGYLTTIPSDYAKKSDIPTVPSNVSAFNNDAGYLTQHQSLSEYAKKSDIPTIPSNVSAFNNDAGYLTQHQSLTEYAKKSDLPVVPTDVSAFNNDAGYLTQHQSLAAYSTTQQIDNKLTGYLPTTGGTLTGHLTLGTTGETAFKKVEAIRNTNGKATGAAFYVNSDGSAGFFHKSYNGTSAVNDAILKFDKQGLYFGTAETGNVSEYKKVLTEDDVPEHWWFGFNANGERINQKAFYDKWNGKLDMYTRFTDTITYVKTISGNIAHLHFTGIVQPQAGANMIIMNTGGNIQLTPTGDIIE